MSYIRQRCHSVMARIQDEADAAYHSQVKGSMSSWGRRQDPIGRQIELGATVLGFNRATFAQCALQALVEHVDFCADGLEFFIRSREKELPRLSMRQSKGGSVSLTETTFTGPQSGGLSVAAANNILTRRRTQLAERIASRDGKSMSRDTRTEFSSYLDELDKAIATAGIVLEKIRAAETGCFLQGKVGYIPQGHDACADFSMHGQQKYYESIINVYGQRREDAIKQLKCFQYGQAPYARPANIRRFWGVLLVPVLLPLAMFAGLISSLSSSGRRHHIWHWPLRLLNYFGLRASAIRRFADLCRARGGKGILLADPAWDRLLLAHQKELKADFGHFLSIALPNGGSDNGDVENKKTNVDEAVSAIKAINVVSSAFQSHFCVEPDFRSAAKAQRLLHLRLASPELIGDADEDPFSESMTPEAEKIIAAVKASNVSRGGGKGANAASSLQDRLIRLLVQGLPIVSKLASR